MTNTNISTTSPTATDAGIRETALTCACGVYADRCDGPQCSANEIEENYPPGSLLDLGEELRGYWGVDRTLSIATKQEAGDAGQVSAEGEVRT